MQLNASDGINHNLTVITITVSDTIAPQWNPLPSDQSVQLGQSFSYDTDATDVQIVSYWVNDTTNFAIDGNGLLTNNSVLSLGPYYLRLNASDGTNINSTTIVVTVLDTTKPLWNPTPIDQNVNLGQLFSYDINATDLQSILYYINDTVNFTIDINTGILQNNTILSVTTYYLQINATDASNNNATIEISINVVEDSIPPLIEFNLPPINNTIITETSYTINITVTDDNPPTFGDVTIEFLNNTFGSLFNDTMTYVDGVQWTYTWTNVSSYNNEYILIRPWATDTSPNLNLNNSIYMNVTIDIPYIPPPREGGGGGGDDDDEKEADLLTIIMNFITDTPMEFINDLMTNPTNIVTKPNNLMFIGIIAGILIGITVLIKRRKQYKTKDKEVKRIVGIIQED